MEASLNALEGNIEERELTTEMRSSYLDYAMSVIVGRALPDARDGLKPVHRRVLYAMHDLGLQPNRPHRKCAYIVGEVMGKYHPHGDTAIYDTLVRMAQEFSLRTPLVDGQGNFGSIDDDPAAAMRYCVTGDTRVALVGGTVRIDSIAGGMGPDSEREVDLVALDRLAQPVRASKVFHSGAQPTLRLQTVEGFELTGSPNHPVLCLVDVAGVPAPLWKLLSEIRPGDRVMINRTARSETEKLSVRERAAAARAAGLVREVSSLTCYARQSAHSIPESVWQASPQFKRAFLESLFCTEELHSDITLPAIDPRLAKDLQVLLLECGIVVRLERDAVGVALVAVDPHRSVPLIAGFVRDEERFGGTTREALAVVEPLVTGDYYYAGVESITDAGIQPVYSLKVETGDHSFLTNGFVSHNTEARLARIATEMLRDIDSETVDFGPNYDEKAEEPLILPARFPNLLVNGSSGIAVGMATNIPPHNLGEVIGAVNAYLDDPEIDLAGLMEHVKGPDFPGGGVIMGTEGIRDAYATGRGSIKVRARAHVEPLKRGKQAIIVTELPFMVKKGGDGGLITKIADLVREKKITEISDLRDESDRSGMRLVIECKQDAVPKIVLNKLYKHTQMQTSFGANVVALVDGVPRTLALKELIHHYVGHQREVVIRRTQFQLRKAEDRAHVLEGLLIALDNLDAVIALIRGSADADVAREGLIKKFKLTEVQARAILEMQLRRLTALDSKEIREEHAELTKTIAELRAILGDEKRIDGIIREELAAVGERYADERRTEIAFDASEVDIEDMIADQQMVVSITASGYAKRLPVATYRQQRRGGVGVMGMNMKEGDYIEHLHICSTHDFMLFFTNRGKVYRLKVYELPEGSRQSKGKALVNVLPLRDGERVMAVKPTRDFTEGRYLAFATAKGQVKKTEFAAYNTKIKADGIIAIKVRDDDELVGVRLTSGDDDLLLVSKSGHASRFSEKLVRPMGRDTGGVRGMNVSGKGNRVLAMDVVREEAEVFVVTEGGYGKRTLVSEYPAKGRGTKGVLTIRLVERKGGLAGAMMVREHQDLLFISDGGMVQRTSVKGISRMGRATQGVKVMNMKEEERVSAVALVVESESDTGEPVVEDDDSQAQLEEV